METLRKCIVTHFEARGLKQLLEPWRCVRAGGAGTFWNRGDAFSSLGTRKFFKAPRGTQRIGHSKDWQNIDMDICNIDMYNFSINLNYRYRHK